jgi:hypothetical protein
MILGEKKQGTNGRRLPGAAAIRLDLALPAAANQGAGESALQCAIRNVPLTWVLGIRRWLAPWPVFLLPSAIKLAIKFAGFAE